MMWSLRRGVLSGVLLLALAGAACSPQAEEALEPGDEVEGTAVDEAGEAGSGEGPAAGEETPGDEETVVEETPGEQAIGEPEVDTIVVGAVAPGVSAMTINHGQDSGYFAEHGLEIEFVYAASGAALVPQLLGGDIDILMTTHDAIINAASQGVGDFALIVDDQVLGGHDWYHLISFPDTGVEQVEDLEGATVAVNALGGYAEIVVRAALEDAGLAPDAVTFTEMPMPSMAPAIQSGDIDAAWQPLPFLLMAQAQGAVLVKDLYDVAELQDMPLGGYYATQAFVDQNPNAAATFRQVRDRALTDIVEDEEREIRLRYQLELGELPREVAERMADPSVVFDIDFDRLQRVADLMHRYDILDQPFDVTAFDWDGL